MKQTIFVKPHSVSTTVSTEAMAAYLDALPTVDGYPLNVDLSVSATEISNFPKSAPWFFLGGLVVDVPKLALELTDGVLSAAYLVFEELYITSDPCVPNIYPRNKHILPVYSSDLEVFSEEKPCDAVHRVISFMVDGVEVSVHFSPVSKSSNYAIIHCVFTGIYSNGVQVAGRALTDKTCPLVKSIKNQLEAENKPKFKLPAVPTLKTLSEKPCTLEELQAVVVQLAELVNKQAAELNKKQTKPWRASI